MQMNAPTSPITFLNPPTLSAVPPTFSHLAVVEPPVRMIYVAGTVGATSAGVVAEGFDAQVALAFDNVTITLAAAGATGKDVVKLTYYIIG
jgi:enamine deaminase RidA (YjgF/YER057c/UK114 family)